MTTARTTTTVPTMLTQEEAARILKKSTKTLQNWRWRRVGPPVTKVEGEPMYNASLLVDWLNSRTTG